MARARATILGSKNINHIFDYIDSSHANRWQWGRAAARGYARYIRDVLLRGRLLQQDRGLLRRSVSGRSAVSEPGRPRNAVGVVSAGNELPGTPDYVSRPSRGVPYARAHEFGVYRVVRVNDYWKPSIRKMVKGHFRRMNLLARHFMEIGARNGDDYARFEVLRLNLELQTELEKGRRRAR